MSALTCAQEERREPSDIKQRRNVMNETLMMVCDAESRLTAACKDLCDFISSHADVCRPALREVSSPSDKGPGEAGERPERWLVEELTAVRDALLRATEVNPAHPASMELFEDRDHKDENAGSCEESLDDI